MGKGTDPGGAAIPGGKVSVVNQATNPSREALTDSFRSYDFPNQPTGAYVVNAGAHWFSTFVKTDLPLTINNVTRFDITLQLGEVAETTF